MNLAIEARDLHKEYSTRGGLTPFLALQGVSLEVPVGSFATISGPSGSGKSTLLSILGLLDRPTRGHLSVLGIPASGLKESSRTRVRATYLAFVFQSFHLMPHRSAVDNVALGGLYRGLSVDERAEQAIAALERVGLGTKSMQRAVTLSGGEQQRLAIARALVGGPRILFCDEPTGNLDSLNSAGICELIRELHQQGLTILLVSHDPAVARLGDQQIEVRDGYAIGDGCE